MWAKRKRKFKCDTPGWQPSTPPPLPLFARNYGVNRDLHPLLRPGNLSSLLCSDGTQELAGLLLGAGLWATPSAAFSLPVPPPKGDFGDFYEYTKSHVGRWRGLWRTYDSEGVEQGPPDRMDTTLDLSSDGKTLTHVNTL